MSVVFHVAHNGQNFRELFRLFIWAVVGGKRFKNVGNGHNFGRNGHLVAGEAVGIAFAVYALVVGAGIFNDF